MGGPTSNDPRRQGFLEAALDCVLMADEFGRVVEFNPSAERVFGYKREEALGRTLAELIVPPALRASHQAAFARFVQTGQQRLFGRRVELTAMRSDGSEFPVELALSQVEGEPLLVCGAVRDLTEAKRAKEDSRAGLLTSNTSCDEWPRSWLVGLIYKQWSRPCVPRPVAWWAPTRCRWSGARPDGLRLTLADWSPDDGPLRRRHQPSSEPPSENQVDASILVEGAEWGFIFVGADHPLPATTAESVAGLAELTAISVANANARSELIASRARIVAAADEARRRTPAGHS